MEIKKAGALTGTGVPDERQLEQINRWAKTPLTAEQVYVFSVRLCDDAVDRDFEQFSTQALPRLAELFVGKTGICDHEWSSQRQVARIFDAQVIRDGAVSLIQAWVYMLRNEKTQTMIGEIEGGIKKEVSVGCAMGKSTCSICGKPYGSCEHRKGEIYGGNLCTAILSEPVDAYEFSFVAVPAQRQAGVMKRKGGACVKLEDYVAKSQDPLLMDSLSGLQREAELGRAYRKQLEQDAVRLGLCLDFGADEDLLRTIAQQMDDGALQRFCKGLQSRVSTLMESVGQLPGTKPLNTDCGKEFMI